MTDNKKQNRLLNEKSPYLHQHAFNPVDWYPWGKEAFDKARAEDKLVFLSIGYSTCHWCHVMAHESFEDMDVAEILNRDYVSIKVDREERPDIDAVYMSVCQSMTGSGGWPLTIIMNYDQKPFFAGTYFPKNSVHGRMGLMGLLREVTRQWNTNREKLNSAGSNIVSMLKNSADDYVSSQEPSKELSDRGANQLKHNYDPKWGGFGMAPKFPTPHNLVFLMRYSDFENDSKSMEMAEKTLEQMYRGGMFDHVGGGFSRYSTDEKWLVPHFEKMLYDNALLTGAYIEAYRFTHRELYRIVAERTMAYVLRELTHPQGGFFCGQDADSEGVEGKYYVFTQEEIHELLGTDDGNYFCRYYGITAGGNFEGKNIPNLIGSPEKETENDRIRTLRQKVRAYREVRASLHKDDKILTSWNSLMIASLARASVTLGEPMYMDAAKRAQQFIAKNLVDKNGQLLVRWRDGEAAISGHLDDYAFYLYALLELYASTFDVYYFKEAIHFANVMVEQFFDKERGGFFLYASDGEKLISRPKEVFDGAMPSGNSVAALSLPRLSILSGDTYWTEIADKQLGFIASAVSSYPSAYTFSLLAIMEAVYPSTELVCTSSDNKVPAELIELLKGSNVQNLNVHVKTPLNSGILSNLALYTGEYSIPRSGNLYYLCRNRACSQPVSRINELKKMLSSVENETTKRK